MEVQMPAVKKSKRKAAEAEAAAAVEDAPVKAGKKGKKGKKGKSAAAESNGSESTGRRGRAAKDYGVTGEQIAEMRENKMSWQEIQDEVGAKSAIPLRNMMNKYLAEQDDDDAIDPTDGDAIVEARDEEALGWGAIQARAGGKVGIAELKKLYVEAGGKSVDGRAYKDKDGNVNFRIGANGAKSDESDDASESEYDDMSRKELVAALKERGLDTKGKSPVLISRLMEDDEANAESEDSEDAEPEPTPKRKKGKGKKGAKAGR
jgi:hypothetical protein